jgi:hypothetical protein
MAAFKTVSLERSCEAAFRQVEEICRALSTVPTGRIVAREGLVNPSLVLGAKATAKKERETWNFI